MKIDTTVPDVDSFVTAYNGFIDALAARIRAEENSYMAYRLSVLWKIFELPKVYKDHLLTLELTNEGHLMVETFDLRFSWEFELFWQDYQARWEIADQDIPTAEGNK
jgi:hypothetical protein